MSNVVSSARPPGLESHGAIEFIFFTKTCLYKLHIEHAIILHTFVVTTRSPSAPSDAEVNLAPLPR